MTVNQGIWIYNSAVNSGNPMYVSGGFKYSANKEVQTDTIPGKVSGTEFDIAEANKGGIANPTITISGSYNVDDIGNNWLTEDLIKDLWRNKNNDTRLTIKIGSTGKVITNYAGNTPTDITTDGIKVEMLNFSVSGNTTSENMHILTFTINFKETCE